MIPKEGRGIFSDKQGLAQSINHHRPYVITGVTSFLSQEHSRVLVGESMRNGQMGTG